LSPPGLIVERGPNNLLVVLITVAIKKVDWRFKRYTVLKSKVFWRWLPVALRCLADFPRFIPHFYHFGKFNPNCGVLTTYLRMRMVQFNQIFIHEDMGTIQKQAIFLLGLAIMAGCHSNPNGQDLIIRKVKIEAVQEADTLEVKSFSGIIREANEVNLAFRVAGPIQKIYVKAGDYVRAGQPVAQIDTRDYEVQLQVAQAQYDQVSAEAGRVVELHNRQSVAGNDYDKAVAGEKMVAAQLKNAKDQLNDTRLLSPVSGYIQKVNFMENELVDAGMPLATLIDVGHYQVEVDIPVSLYIERDAIVSFAGIQAAVSAEEFPLQMLSYGKKANNNQLYKLQLRLNPASHPKLAPGMDIQVNIALKNGVEPMACVPLNALFKDGEKTMVWVYQPAEGTVRKREVVTGKLTRDGRIGIEKGLSLEKEFYNELVKVKSANPGIDDRMALQEASRRQKQKE
jgi:RND family efflux transporter MFP subunit